MSLPVAILAGGLGTRLGNISLRTPKSLIDVAGKPFVEHQLALLRHHGLTKIVLCIGHLGQVTEAALGDGSRLGMCLRYSYDGPTLLGTGGALRRALPFLGQAFFILYGDSYLECDYSKIEAMFLASGKPGLMTVYRNQDRWDRSNVLFRDGRILRYDKERKIAEMQHIDYGLGILRAEVLAAYPADRSFDLETVYKDLVEKDQLAGFEVKERFYEIGSPAGLVETRLYLNKKLNRKDL